MHSDETPVETIREVAAVAARCKGCGMATRVLIHEAGRLEGEPYRALWGEDIPHTSAECERFQALEREQWPTLF